MIWYLWVIVVLLGITIFFEIKKKKLQLPKDEEISNWFLYVTTKDVIMGYLWFFIILLAAKGVVLGQNLGQQCEYDINEMLLSYEGKHLSLDWPQDRSYNYYLMKYDEDTEVRKYVGLNCTWQLNNTISNFKQELRI